MARGNEVQERLGLDSPTHRIMGVELPFIELLVRPGRNIPILIEVIAMNERAKRLGYDTATELDNQLKTMLLKDK